MHVSVAMRATAVFTDRAHSSPTMCRHYGAQMEKGVLAGDRLTCPWHAACFNVETGDIEDGPVFDKLPVYAVDVDSSGDVWVSLPTSADKVLSKETPHMCSAHTGDTRHYVIIGAGPCGLAAAETLRQEGYGGRITLLNREAALPYDRTKLSKNMAAEVEGLVLRKEEWFAKHGIAVRLGVEVKAVRSAEHEVVLTNGEIVKYDKLLCATGGPARTFKPGEMFVTPGAELANIFPLREGAHSEGIEKLVDSIGADKVKVVIVGSSFIGMEAAAYLVGSKKVKSVRVIGMEAEPFERVLGVKIGAFMRSVHEEKGVKFHMKAKVNKFVGKDGVTGVEITGADGKAEILAADVVILGAGIIPSVEYLKETAGVSLLTKAPGGVEVDAGMAIAGATAAADIFAAGDIAYFPYQPPGAHAAHGTRIEHWDVAIDQGRVAARNMLGQGVKYSSIPFFWTGQYGKSLRYAGHSLKTDDIIFHGDVKGLDSSFVAFFVADGRVAAVTTWNKDPQGVAAMELMRLGAMPEVSLLRDAKQVDLQEYLRTLTVQKSG